MIVGKFTKKLYDVWRASGTQATASQIQTAYSLNVMNGLGIMMMTEAFNVVV